MAIVGARRCTKYGEDIAYRAAYELASHGVIIVSGMAYGIDACAHRGCLDAGGTTIAVLGTAIDNLYPRSNFGLAQRILEKGAILSEYGPGFETRAYNFQVRNRIVSGLADVVLIVEAALGSGTFGTYDFALKQGKDIFAVPDILFRFGMSHCKPERDLSNLSDAERKIYLLIKDGVRDADEIVARLNLSVVDFNCAITTLELDNYVVPIGQGWATL